MSRVATASPAAAHDDGHSPTHDDGHSPAHDHDHEHEGHEDGHEHEHEQDELQDDDGPGSGTGGGDEQVAVPVGPHHHPGMAAHHGHGQYGPIGMVAVDYGAVQQPLATRKRVRLACSNCHKGKIKCDGERPCDRCLKKGLAPEECVDFQRKRTACTSCRAVKMKCDGNRPCKRCIKKGKGDECTDIDGPGTTVPRRSREHRVGGRSDGDDDTGRPVPYNYEAAAEAAAAAAAGYYYGAAPPWAYHPDASGHWAPYMYPHAAYAAQAAMASAAAAGQAASAGEGESSKSYPEMQVDPALAGEEGGEAWSMAQKNGEHGDDDGEDGEGGDEAEHNDNDEDDD